MLLFTYHFLSLLIVMSVAFYLLYSNVEQDMGNSLYICFGIKALKQLSRPSLKYVSVKHGCLVSLEKSVVEH